MISPKEELVQQLDTLLQAPNFERNINQCASLIEQYLQLDLEEKIEEGLIEEMSEEEDAHQQEESEAETRKDSDVDGESSEAGESASAGSDDDIYMPPADPLQERMISLIDRYNEKREELLGIILKDEEENFKKKKELLESLRKLIEEEENIGKAFKEFNQIRDDWNSVGPVAEKQRQNLHRDYSNLMELFYYNINIYKQLKDHDLKRNLELKQDVLQQLKDLQQHKDLRTLEEGVNLCIDRWNDIGPTSREEWEKLKEDFWSLVKETYNTIRDLHKDRREEQKKNLELKEELVKKVNEIAELDLQHLNKWQEKTDEIIALQEAWKKIGYASRDKNEAVWKEFRGACDKFFEKKRAFFKDIRKEQDEHATKKESLIARAEKLKDSTDWKNATRELINLQKEWKEVGSAHQRVEQKLWRQFRGTCDHFFKRKKEFFATLDDRQADNLKQKEALIKELEAFQLSGEQIKDLEALKDFSQRFNAIDHVPFKDKDRIHKAYSDALDEKYKGLKMDRRDREAEQFKNRIATLKDNDADHVVEREARNLRDRMSKLKAEVIQLENNLGFFANSKGADALKKDVENKINRAKQEIEDLDRKLRVVKKMA